MLHKEIILVNFIWIRMIHNCIIRYFNLNVKCGKLLKQQTKHLSLWYFSMKYINDQGLFELWKLIAWCLQTFPIGLESEHIGYPFYFIVDHPSMKFGSPHVPWWSGHPGGSWVATSTVHCGSCSWSCWDGWKGLCLSVDSDMASMSESQTNAVSLASEWLFCSSFLPCLFSCSS